MLENLAVLAKPCNSLLALMDHESIHVFIVINMFRVTRITCKVLNNPKWDDFAPEHES